MKKSETHLLFVNNTFLFEFFEDLLKYYGSHDYFGTKASFCFDSTSPQTLSTLMYMSYLHIHIYIHIYIYKMYHVLSVST